LLDRDGFLKVADFGFAKKLDAENRTWTLCGTPEHLAPEIIQNKGHNSAADWWTLGINMYEFLAGMPPFNDDTPIGTYRLIIAGNFEFPEEFDPDAKDIITKFLTADPTKRLGCLAGLGNDVMAHPFFASIDFGELITKRIPPPFTPEVEDDEDISNFEEPEERDDDIDVSDVVVGPDDFANW
jgi:serine/threonine protein kinase